MVGTTYGAGDGSTTFNVIDKRGRTSIGKDDMGGGAAGRITSGGSGITGTTLGANGGAETVTVSQANLPNINLNVTIPAGQGSHNHTGTAPFSIANQTQAGSDIAKASNGSTAITINSNTLPQMTGNRRVGRIGHGGEQCAARHHRELHPARTLGRESHKAETEHANRDGGGCKSTTGHSCSRPREWRLGLQLIIRRFLQHFAFLRHTTLPHNSR